MLASQCSWFEYLVAGVRARARGRDHRGEEAEGAAGAGGAGEEAQGDRGDEEQEGESVEDDECHYLIIYCKTQLFAS